MNDQKQEFPETITQADLGQLLNQGLNELYVDEEYASVVESETYGKAIAGFDSHGSIPHILVYLAEKELSTENVLKYQGQIEGLPHYYVNWEGLAFSANPLNSCSKDNPVYEEFHPLLTE